jgi:hypothetical protein
MAAQYRGVYGRSTGATPPDGPSHEPCLRRSPRLRWPIRRDGQKEIIPNLRGQRQDVIWRLDALNSWLAYAIPRSSSTSP